MNLPWWLPFGRVPEISAQELNDIVKRSDAQCPSVAICATAHRSPPAVRLLRAPGYENAVQFRSGMLGWYAARLPTRK
jgi:rhodanese-related sulfurtransferase